MRRSFFLVGGLCLLTISCNNTNEVADPQQPRVSLSVSNLQPLGPGEGHYEVWATFLEFNKPSRENSPQHESGFLSLGEFNVRAGDPVPYDRAGNPARFIIPPDQNPQLLDDVVITIDTSETNTVDSLQGSIVIGGQFRGDADVAVADLDEAYADAFSSDFSGVTGKFTITAPTSPADSNSGVWFIDQQGATTVAGLRNLPVLPKGWRYEGWVGYAVVQIQPGKTTESFHYFSTGRFLRADTADFDGAGPGRGLGTGLGFPGQDFITSYVGGPPPPVDLRYRTFMVTIEPVPDNSPDPFSLAVLSTQSPRTALPQGQAVSMNNVASSLFARARITVVRSGY